MKKSIVIIAAVLVSAAANAQDNFDPFKDRQFIFDSVNICAVLLVIYLLSGFILKIMKQSLDFKLKSRMLDKQTGEPVIAQLLQPESNKESRKYLLQWFFILTAIGIGFTAMKLSGPLGLHSLAIMAFSIAAGFGGYYYFTRNTNSNS